MTKIIRIILIITITGMTACSTKEDIVVDKKVQEPDLIQASALNVQLALGYIERDQLNIAQEKLDKAIEQNPDNVDAYTTYAYLKRIIKEYDVAEDYYLQALDIKSNDPNIHNNYGGLLCQIGRYDDALDEIQKAYKNPFYETLYLAYANAGTCLLQKGDYKEAEIMLRKALREQPSYSSALISMAEIGVATEKYMMARAYIQRYHAVARPSAESLWLQIQSEKALGAQEHYLKYARQLIREFPDSDEAGLLEEMAKNERIRE
ncbi:MAG: type IV pilus biogenesis/stability protein PilW [Thiotrichales bacterium]|nr:MAG: type IV pilus biogenesis/stability protein PilW [Thiotrichales bacterium]